MTTGVLEVLAGVGLLVVMRVIMGDRLGAIAPALILFVVNGYLFWRSLTAS